MMFPFSASIIPGVQKAEMLDRPRKVNHADVLFDSNVLRANDDDAERKLHAPTTGPPPPRPRGWAATSASPSTTRSTPPGRSEAESR